MKMKGHSKHDEVGMSQEDIESIRVEPTIQAKSDKEDKKVNEQKSKSLDKVSNEPKQQVINSNKTDKNQTLDQNMT
jgi:hypothetical protein